MRGRSVSQGLILLPAFFSLFAFIIWVWPDSSSQPSEPEHGSIGKIQEITYAPILPRYTHYFQKYFSDVKPQKNQADNKEKPNIEQVDHQQVWRMADTWISKNGLYENQQEESLVLLALQTAKIVHVDFLDVGDYETGTDTTKWVVSLEGGGKAMVKLMWEKKGDMKEDSLCNKGFEMPWAEIAAYHLHSILGFHNTPAVTGRILDIAKEIVPVASPAVVKTITVSESGTCIVGNCKYCSTPKTLCSPNHRIEASFSHWTPRRLKLYTWWPNYMPWSTPNMAEWELAGFNNQSYCNKVHNNVEPYQHNHYYYDLFDFAVFDSLMYHFDSKHYIISDDSDAKGATVRLDHGRAFCSYTQDELRIFLAPIQQCCILRSTTYFNLASFKPPSKLSKVLRASLVNDPLHPLLLEQWYAALERRLIAILDMVQKCAYANGGLNNVLV